MSILEFIVTFIVMGALLYGFSRFLTRAFFGKKEK